MKSIGSSLRWVRLGDSFLPLPSQDRVNYLVDLMSGLKTREAPAALASPVSMSFVAKDIFRLCKPHKFVQLAQSYFMRIDVFHN